MRYRKSIYILLFLAFISTVNAVEKDSKIPLPTPAQLRWQNYNQIMFLCLDPATWQAREYDNHSLPLDRINPKELNTDQWCEVAQLWGAKLILFVAKHTGGFCWWQTQTTEYSIRNIPWKNGQGDVLKELSESCKKYKLDLGIYVYPGDEHWGAGIGSGGITKDPAKQLAYNEVYRKQLTEVLTQYGPIREVWFDGNCRIPINDILEKYASNAVILQSEKANLRWVGNEDGIAPYPNWYTLKKEDLDTGVSTALHSDVDGEAYAPVEVDVPFLKNNGHKWFWAPNSDHLLMSQEQLMNLYYKSTGRGSVLLLNSTPDTSGLIPASHVEVYKAFGKEISKRFDRPLKRTASCSTTVELSFTKPTEINHCILQEDLSKGQRVVSYLIEGSMNGSDWNKLYEGSSVGNKKIDYFKTATVKKIRVRFLKFKDTPQIKNFAVYHVQSDLDDLSKMSDEKPVVVSNWEASTFNETDWTEFTLDLTPYVNSIGHYDVSFSILTHDFTNTQPTGLEFKDWQLEMYGSIYPEGVKQLPGNQVFRITRSQQTLDDFPTRLKVKIKRKPSKSSGEITIKRITF